jgi:hypothetical protein
MADPLPSTPAPEGDADAELIALGKRVLDLAAELDRLSVLGMAADEAGDKETERRHFDAGRALVPGLHLLLDEVAGASARTFAGLRQKARVLLTRTQFNDDGTPFDSRHPPAPR